jgi:hypothetical protein
MEAQRGRGSASLGDGSLGCGGAPSRWRWRRSRGAITTGAPLRWRRAGVESSSKLCHGGGTTGVTTAAPQSRGRDSWYGARNPRQVGWWGLNRDDSSAIRLDRFGVI